MEHVLVFPLPMAGHINPFTCLADYLVSSGLLVTFVHTARSFSLLSRHASLPPSHNPRIEVIPDDLPTDPLTQPSRAQIISSFPILHNGLDDLMLKLATSDLLPPPSCIFTESLIPWTHDFACKHGISRIDVWTMSATVYSLWMHIPDLVAKGYLPLDSGSEEKVVDFLPGLPRFPLSHFPKEIAAVAANGSALEYISSIVSNSKTADRVFINSFDELEGSVIEGLRGHQWPVCNIGPLLPSVYGNSTNRSLRTSFHPEDHGCLHWLDTQADASVLFVSFGSFHSVQKETIHELAHGLEASKEKFLWVIRPDVVKGSLDEILPEGFQSRTGERSQIISWAPQLEVLAHRAVGSFLTHCGWNSTIESLYMGVPMIGFPQGADQDTTLECVVEWKVGMALGKHAQESHKCSREEVEGVVRAMMQGEEGKAARKRAQELKELARKSTKDGKCQAQLALLVEDLKLGKVTAFDTDRENKTSVLPL